MIIEHPTSADLLLAAQFLKAGKLVAFPTETVYGLGADAKMNRPSTSSLTPKVVPRITL